MVGLPIKLILNYSRSGGTLLTRVLGSLPNCVVLSEVNPYQQHSGHYDVAEQMKKWYGVAIQGTTFIEKISFIHKWCNEHSKHLIIRDVSAFDFMPNSTNDFNPKGKLSTYNLLKDNFKIHTICFVRDAFDIWISRGCPPKFADHYINYLHSIHTTGCVVFKYENFCNSPFSELQCICKELDLPYSENAIHTYYLNTKITGDIDISKTSRGISINKIRPLKRKRISYVLVKKVSRNEEIKNCNSLMGYPTNFLDESITFENYPNRVLVELKFWYTIIFHSSRLPQH